MKEAWWVDYIEGEMSEEQTQDMQMVLRFSQADREILHNLRVVREKVKECGPPPMPKDDFFNGLQSKIMMKVRTMPPPEKPKAMPSMVLRKFLDKALENNNKKFKMAQYYFSLGN